jgi:hypothetical protein
MGRIQNLVSYYAPRSAVDHTSGDTLIPIYYFNEVPHKEFIHERHHKDDEGYNNVRS